MSANEDGVGALRTVTPLTGTGENAQMNAIGWVIFLLLAVVLLPLLPVILAILLVSRLLGR